MLKGCPGHLFQGTLVPFHTGILTDIYQPFLVGLALSMVVLSQETVLRELTTQILGSESAGSTAKTIIKPETVTTG